MGKALIVGNWKMNGLRADLAEIAAIASGCTPALAARCDLVICPPATLLREAAECAAETPLRIGAQDCHGARAGPHTGDLAAPMLRDCGASFVILGHSERRSAHREGNRMIAQKCTAARAGKLDVILCVGETGAERAKGIECASVARQLRGSLAGAPDARGLAIAYEPIWAIGTGETPTIAQISAVHDEIRNQLSRRFGEHAGRSVRMLYGGSVKPANAREILALPAVDGVLVGGASLRARDFLAIAAEAG